MRATAGANSLRFTRGDYHERGAAALLLVTLATTTDVLNDLATTAASRAIEEGGG